MDNTIDGEGTTAYLNRVLGNTPKGGSSSSGISSSADTSVTDGGSDNLLSTIDSQRNAIIELEDQIIEQMFVKVKNVLSEYDDRVTDITKKNSTLKNESDDTLDGNRRVEISKEIDKNLTQELSLTKEKEAYIKREIASRKYTVGQVAELNSQLLEVLDSESSISLEIQQQYNDKITIIQSAESKITEIINKQVEKRKKIISDQYDAEKKAITDTQALYSKQNTTDDYNKNLTTEQKSLSDINASITSASRDTSSSGLARVAQLKLDLKTQQDKIDAMVLDRGRALNNDKYDTELTKLDDQNTATLKKMDETYSEENINKMASASVASGVLTDINDKVVSLNSAYIAFENEFGEGMSAMGDSIKANLIATLTQASGLMKSMGIDSSTVSAKKLVDGSHESGLKNVPKNGYIAELHKDEGVLTKEENTEYKKLKAMGILNNLGQIAKGKFNNLLTNFNIPKSNNVDMSNVKSQGSTSPVINFNKAFMEIGSVSNDIDMEKWAIKARDMATSAIYDAIKA